MSDYQIPKGKYKITGSMMYADGRIEKYERDATEEEAAVLDQETTPSVSTMISEEVIKAKTKLQKALQKRLKVVADGSIQEMMAAYGRVAHQAEVLIMALDDVTLTADSESPDRLKLFEESIRHSFKEREDKHLERIQELTAEIERLQSHIQIATDALEKYAECDDFGMDEIARETLAKLRESEGADE